MFLFKKIISPFFLPIPLCLTISLVGLFLILFTKRQKAGKFLISVGLCTLAILSYNPIPNYFIARLERQHHAYTSGIPVEGVVLEHNPVEYVVVLAGGIGYDSKIPITSLLSDLTLIRVIEGVLIYRENPGSKLVLSGGSRSELYPEATGMADLAKAIGVDEDDIVIECYSRDTKDQARLIKTIVGDKPFILVTSAYHMPRSMAFFKKFGMEPIPAPADYLVTKRKIGINSFFPGSGALRKSEIAVHEYLGMCWARLRGQI
ncbi:MAG: ElyC/SanA/YdcF family protein [Thermodesulfobacteriota bacterium]